MPGRLSLLALAMLITLAPATASAQDAPCQAALELMTSQDGVDYVRTPDACFDELPDWDYEARYVDIDGLRQAYVDHGGGDSGETILLLHGQPAWSYLYRKMMPALAAAGHRVIAMDHIGMGRSDKPIDPDYYTYLGHVARLERFIQALDLDAGDLTLFAHDWGSLIGLYVVGSHSDWFARVVVGHGTLPSFPAGALPAPLPPNPQLTRQLYYRAITSMPARQVAFYDDDGRPLNPQGRQNFGIWIDYARNDERFMPSQVIEAMTYFDIPPEEEAAYDAPFPSRLAMGGPRAFPGLVNQLPGLTQAALDGLRGFEKPFLTIWGGNDPGGVGRPETQQALLELVPGSAGWDHVRLPEASHFFQDDQGEEIARRVNVFMARSAD